MVHWHVCGPGASFTFLAAITEFGTRRHAHASTLTGTASFLASQWLHYKGAEWWKVRELSFQKCDAHGKAWWRTFVWLWCLWSLYLIRGSKFLFTYLIGQLRENCQWALFYNFRRLPVIPICSHDRIASETMTDAWDTSTLHTLIIQKLLSYLMKENQYWDFVYDISFNRIEDGWTNSCKWPYRLQTSIGKRKESLY